MLGPGRTPLNREQKCHRVVALPATLLCLVIAAIPAFAEGGIKPAAEKWRPKNGTYAEPGANFNARCGEFGDTQIEWGENSISGGEEGCTIAKVSDTASGAIRLDVLCTNSEREKPYKEIAILKKVDDKTIFIRETQNGKFKRAGGPMSYCPEEAQRLYSESRKKQK